MKKILLITLLVLFNYGCASISIIDYRQNKKKLIVETETVFQNGIIIESREYYENGNIEEEMFFTGGTITMMKAYYENGKLEEQYNLKNRTYVEYNEDGIIDEEGEIDDLSFGLLVGFSSLTNLVALTELVEMPEGSGINKEYYENGNIKEEISYKNGKLNGVSMEYYENGSLKSESTFKDGLLNG